MSILVITERQNGTWHKTSWEALAAGIEIGKALGRPVTAAVVGERTDALEAELAGHAVERVIAVRHPLVDVIIVDAVQFPDVAERYKVRSTPTVIINDAATLVGQVSDEDLVKHLIPHDTGDSFTEVLKSMIDAGRAEDAAQLMCRNKNPKAILPIYQSDEFSSRLGALVVMDEALEIDPACLNPIVEDLMRILSEGDTPVRGDTAELLGRIRHPAAIPALEKAAEDPNPDVREAAQEALELLNADTEKH